MRFAILTGRSVGLLAFGASAASAQDEAPRQVLFTNVNIFNGVDGELMENGSVLVEGKLIKTVPMYWSMPITTVRSTGRLMLGFA